MRKTLMIVAMLTPLAGWAQQLEFKGLLFGSPREAFRELSVTARTYTCLPKEADGVEVCVVEGLTYAGAATKSIQAYFQDDRLYMVLVAAPSAAFPEIVGALTDKYGKPKVDKREEIKTRMGATFEQRTVAWPFGAGYISARRYDGDIDTTRVTLLSAEGSAVIDRRAAARKPAAKKDI